ncbi:phosphoglycerate mutase [Scenedesmus sp. NREL 46B-D3]|nr:phosphoglycerate mutase [Scenedesmus sp. NREL 46B-D3]
MLPVQNIYWVLRHGRSKANEAAIIVSTLENGLKPEYGLADAGKQQAEAAGQLMLQQLQQQGVPLGAVQVYSSPFSRTAETASIAAVAAGLDPAAVQLTPLLRERCFGAKLELTCHQNYCPAWEGDAADPDSKPCGCVDGESVQEVAARLRQLFQELEQQHEGQHILLVSHGDTLSILQATFHGTCLAQHRQYGLGTAELKQLNGSGGSRQAIAARIAEPRAAAESAVAASAEAVCMPELVQTAASS